MEFEDIQHEINRLVLHPLGLELRVLQLDGHLVISDTHNPALCFPEGDLDAEKAKSIMAEMFERRGARIKALGYVIQPIPGEKVLTVNYTDPDAQAPATEHFDGVGEVEFER